jgi:hypothetical protein
MPYKRIRGESRPIREPACIYLRSKALFTTGEIQNPEHADDSGAHCWCNITQHVIGPDQSDVERATCIPGRNCFREIYDD